jgi:hypothetical protein
VALRRGGEEEKVAYYVNVVFIQYGRRETIMSKATTTRHVEGNMKIMLY